ncbi:MAG: LysE family transporter [Bacteroidales bacterium]|nr:LysE family transporter [Bacteroidales bacterium]
METVNLLRALMEGISVGFVASVPLGPIGVLCIQRTLSKGRRSGFASGCGAASSDFIYAVVAGFSISMVTDFVQAHRQTLFIGGALVLIFLGIRMLISKPHLQLRQQRQTRQTKASLWQDFVSTFFLTISNPLALFVFMGAFSLVGVQETRLERILIVGGVFVGAITWWFILTLLVGLFRRMLTLRRLLYITRIAGAIIIGLVAISGIVEIVDHISAH